MVWIRLETADKVIINQIMFRVEKLNCKSFLRDYMWGIKEKRGIKDGFKTRIVVGWFFNQLEMQSNY